MDVRAATCFHCGEPMPARGARELMIDGAPRALCCAGCEAAALMIRDAGLGDYYRLRDSVSTRAQDTPTDLSAWDNAEALTAHVRVEGPWREITVLIEGLRCPACAWLIERVTTALDGVASVAINVATARATIRWNGERLTLSAVLAPMTRLGYVAYLSDRDPGELAHRARRAALKRLVVAGLGMMQAMMFAEALYFGDNGGMDVVTRDFFRWIGLLLSTPVVFYSGWPFLRGAWHELRLRAPGMDLLVAATVMIAYVASFYETLRGGPHVYFDSAVMFVFALLAARYVEQATRQRASDAVDLLARARPRLAHRREGEQLVDVPPMALRAGDRVYVARGEAAPADGVLLDARAAFDESLLTGESRAVAKLAGATVLAGSVCVEQGIDITVTHAGAETSLAQRLRLAEQAQLQRPRAVRMAQVLASRFVTTLFALSVIVAAIWWHIDAARVLPVTLAVLAVACPCAMSLAVPAVMATAQARLARRGVLVLRGDALETLARVDTIVFDKTGTLTSGRPTIAQVEDGPATSAVPAASLAAALERGAQHPLAQAFAPHAREDVIARAIQVTPGAGIDGEIDGARYCIGTSAFCGDDAPDRGQVVLAGPHGVIARFTLIDTPRDDAANVVAALRAAGLTTRVCSGDGEAAVAECARACGIDTHQSRMTPEAKLALLRELQAQGHVVAMIGDGINDAAVLAGADVAIAMGEGAAIAHAAADAVLMGARLGGLLDALRVAGHARRIARQSLAWAVGYNAVGIAAAAMGWVPPWVAALGMSLSSLAITLNALRVGWGGATASRATPTIEEVTAS